jgi:tetratricopeptide (TPR) repeat protein
MMKKRSGKRLRLAALGLVAGIVMVGHLPAQAAEKVRGKQFTVSPRFYGQIEGVYRQLSAERYDEAERALDQLARRRRLTLHEQALIWQAYGYVHAGRDRAQQAVEAFEKCLALQAMPATTERSLRYNLAQLHVTLEQYDQAIIELNEWFAETEAPAADAYYLLAIAYAQAGQSNQALAPILTALERSERPPEPWLQLALSLRLGREEYEEAARLLEQLVIRFPKTVYLTQLSAVYGQLGREAEALATLQIAYEGGFLKDDRELRHLAKLYLHREIPYAAARVLERALETGAIKDDAEAWELLADSWLYAKDYAKALAPLIKAADLAASGDMYVRLAQVYLEREQWDAAERAIESGLRKGKLSQHGSALLVAGIARYNKSRYDEAKRAFEEAARYEDARAVAGRWIEYLDRQQVRG